MKTVRVTNHGDKTIFVTVAREQKQLKIHEREHSSSSSSEGGAGMGVTIPGIGGVNIDGRGSSSSSESTKEHSEWDWSPFIQAGESQIAGGASTDFELNIKEDASFWVTVRVGNVATAVNKEYITISNLDIDKNGHLMLRDGGPLKSGDKFYLKNIETDLYLQDPVRSEKWPCGNVGNTKGAHRIRSVDKKDTTLANGQFVKIECVNNTAAGEDCKEYINLYSTDPGWIYYAIASNDYDNQFWSIQKTSDSSNSKGETICDGDIVSIRSKRWTQAQLYVHNEKWLGCANGEKAKWQINRID